MAEGFRYGLRKAGKTADGKRELYRVVLLFSYGYNYKKDGKKVYKPLSMPVGFKIEKKFWTGNRVAKKKEIDHHTLNARLADLEYQIQETLNGLLSEKIFPTPAELRNALQKREDNFSGDKLLDDAQPEESSIETFNQYLTRFISELEAGTRLFNSKRYTLGTIKAYRTFHKHIISYQKFKRKQYNWEHFDQDFYTSFVQWLTNKKEFKPNTVGRHIKNLKVILRAAREEKINTFMEFENKNFKVLRQRVQNIYLSDTELELIEKIDLCHLPKHFDIARDVFLVGCYTAQRYSDYSRINNEMLTEYQGIIVIKLIQMKTGMEVILPISSKLKQLLVKYDYNLPKTYDQKINSRIKEIAKLAGITNLEMMTSTKGGKQMNELIPKYQLVTTHTARRSACTNMYLAGIPTLDIMKISGHKSEREFLNYIKVTQQETAVNLASHPYFK